MKIQTMVLACCNHKIGDIWEICWIEHGRFRSKLVRAKTEPNFKTFAQIRSRKEVSRRELLIEKGLSK